MAITNDWGKYYDVNSGCYIPNCPMHSHVYSTYATNYYPMAVPITHNQPTMNTLTSMLKRILDKDSQTLYKAGYINGDLALTDKGKNALWGIIFDQHKDALVKEAQEELDAEKK